jgi:hypothetical protein
MGGFCACDRSPDIMEEDENEVGLLGSGIANNNESVLIGNTSPYIVDTKSQVVMDVDTRSGNNLTHEEKDSLMSIDDSAGYRSNKTWTQEEDMKLLQLARESNAKNWKKIAIILGNKTGPQCSYRFNKLITEMNKAKWGRNDDIMLLGLVETYGENWQIIVEKMPGKTVEDIRQRFTMKLDPKLKRSRFDKDEDDLILKLHEKYANNWNEIARYFPNRNAAMVKNRYYSHLKNKNKDSTTVNVSETMSNYSSSNAVDYNFGRNSVSYNDKGLLAFKEKMLNEDHDFDDYGVGYQKDNDMMYIDTNSVYPTLEGTYKSTYNWNDDIYTELKNILPLDLIKVDDNSPKIKLLESEDKFKEEYNNVFNYPVKKSSWDMDCEGNGVNTYNNTMGNENESLMKQYQLLENIFKKVYEVSNRTFDGKNLI